MSGLLEDGTAATRHRRHEPPPVSRRFFVGIGAAAGLGLLTSLGLRVDLPEPPAPAPTRRPITDELVLVSAVRALRGLAALAAGLPAADRRRPAVREASAIIARQELVLTGRLTNAGVPTDVIDGPAPAPPSAGATSATPHVGTPTGPTGTGPGQTGPTQPGPASRADLAAALEAAPAPGWEALAKAAEGNRVILLAAASARYAAAIRLGRPLPLAGDAPPAVRTALVARTAPLVYGFEVVAAQSSGDRQRRALATLERLHELMGELDPDSSVPVPGGWRLPFPVTSSPDAGRLATRLVRAAVAATTTIGPLTSAAALAEVARWGARVQALGPAHGVPLAAFPGTTGQGGA